MLMLDVGEEQWTGLGQWMLVVAEGSMYTQSYIAACVICMIAIAFYE